ncbi:MAG TPA: hypothetical protein VIF57_29095 [Polyangia bacterium]|jgi:hypothetical protein
MKSSRSLSPLSTLSGLVVLTITLLAAPRAWAYRPFTGTDADVAELHDIELEIGPVGYLRQEGRGTVAAPALIANWGFARDLELVLEGRQLIPLQPAPGEPRVQIVDTQLDVKWLMREGALQEKTGPSVATEWTILLPETGQSHVGAELAAIASLRWPALTLHANGNIAYTRERTLGLFGGLIAEGPGAWAVRPVAEAFVDREGPGATEWSGLAGAIWHFRPSLSFDAAARLSWIRAAGAATRAFELRAGLTWSFTIG